MVLALAAVYPILLTYLLTMATTPYHWSTILQTFAFRESPLVQIRRCAMSLGYEVEADNDHDAHYVYAVKGQIKFYFGADMNTHYYEVTRGTVSGDSIMDGISTTFAFGQMKEFVAEACKQLTEASK